MNGIHDLGGMHGFGPIMVEPQNREPQDPEPQFHAAWEQTVAASLTGAAGQRLFSVDEFRYTIENMAPLEYLRRSYYEKWLFALERLVVRRGLVSAEELASGRADGPADLATLSRWEPVFTLDTARRFQPGDRVRVRNRHPEEHTRAPRYARGRVGSIVSVAGAEPLPEAAAAHVCEVQHLYRVRFEGTELWGPDGGANDAVYLELWESYLEPVL